MKSFIFPDFPVIVFICVVNIHRSDEWPGLTGGQSLDRKRGDGLADTAYCTMLRHGLIMLVILLIIFGFLSVGLIRLM
jgi:hypothetical protein